MASGVRVGRLALWITLVIHRLARSGLVLGADVLHRERMGVYTAAELTAQGMSRSAITRRTKSGQLTRVLPRVYATEKPDYLGLCVAVAKWKPGAVLSHMSAAWLWGLIDEEPLTIQATIAASAQRASPNWVRLYRRRLPDATERQGVAVVTLAQVFVDAAATLEGDELECFFDTAITRRQVKKHIVEICERSKGMTGMKQVRRQLRLCCNDTRSEAERIVARALSARNFFMTINGPVGNYIGDLVDYVARVIVEIDGREHHISPEAFNNDRRRQNELVLQGWLVLRYSAVQAMSDPGRVAEEIMAVVRRRRASLR